MDIEDPLAGIWDDMPTNGSVEDELAWFRRLEHVQQVIYSTHYLAAEVYNGGFHQYFHNTTAVNAPEAVENFRKLGLNDVADLVEESMLVFGPEFPRDRETRQVFLDAIPGDEPAEWNPFYLFDEKFYDMLQIPGTPPLHNEDRLTVALKKLVKEVAS